ncbi:C-C motif chemokine 3-like [Latimeria chalumnae]|uniref:C-C motif chemokine n=1 Tax=Latimeria chalumnae TaxID=7897 RepID=M3XJG7_LATCH|nr:PREDICTED: C-C motif chemokine 3-like [Latimeria chalumnae]XP_014342909.1 PREDICTED: C-C motif chemokine 3-like [Latimeria chalumnae]|eukprot:XP_014342903.1 PREDICTED: C-C motif chemokine 3-like [Latimeria chalumnae]
MKVTLIATMVLILAANFFEKVTATEIVTVPSTCCFSYQTQQIPMRAIRDFFYTSSTCSKPGLVFITRKGRQACVNPEDRWVKDYLKYL